MAQSCKCSPLQGASRRPSRIHSPRRARKGSIGHLEGASHPANAHPSRIHSPLIPQTLALGPVGPHLAILPALTAHPVHPHRTSCSVSPDTRQGPVLVRFSLGQTNKQIQTTMFSKENKHLFCDCPF